MPNSQSNNNNKLIIFFIILVPIIICCTICGTIFVTGGIKGLNRGNSATRDFVRMSDTRNVNDYLSKHFRLFKKFPNSLKITNTGGGKTVVAYDYYNSSDKLDLPDINEQGINQIVTHGNCGTTTESSWNLVYEVSSDQQSYDLSACQEVGVESPNLSTNPIHKY